MLKTITKITAIMFAIIAITACTSVAYYGPRNHVSYRDTDQVKSSSQKVNIGDKIKTTFDEEYTYDNNGNILKMKMTEYFDHNSNDKKYVVWEIESKILGGKLVPFRVSVNGVVFLEVEYELMTIAGDGAVYEHISDRSFTVVEQALLSQAMYHNIEISIENFPVSFKADDKFVKEVRHFNTARGFYYENVLTLGYDNIVLKRFHISAEKLADGIAKSYSGYNYQAAMLQQWAKGMNVDYNYKWKVIANKICETEMTYESKTLKLVSNQSFDSAGKRINETWFASDPGKTEKKPVKIFEQTLTY